MILDPSNQINLIGHQSHLLDLVNLYLKNNLPNKILLSGEKGIGKCTLSYHLINYILSYNEEHPYNIKNFQINNKNKDFILTHNKTNPNFTLIDVDPDKKIIDIQKIRNLIINLNKSSFNLKPRFVLIDNIELLNVNSVNALLKILEEPNENINFILINNNKKILSTLKSRCLNFKISLTYNQSIDITNTILNENINNILNKELINHYITPGYLLKLIEFKNTHNLDLKNLNLKNFISQIIMEKKYKKEITIKNLLYSLIELYFRKNISIRNINLISMKNYFLKKINDTKNFNLDEDVLFIEFEDKVLNG
jgi:DNA polymerase III subunit delta'